jgi:energy-coupling factor transporter ATP-binding protein EcfA2
MVCKISDETPWVKRENASPSYPPLLMKGSEEGLQSDTGIIPQSAKEKLKSRRMNQEDRERALHMFFFIDHLIPSGFHIVLYGAAGSGKTTVILYLCAQIAIHYHDVEIYYLYLDGQLNMAAGYEELLEEENLLDRYNIITEGNADEMLSEIEALVEEEGTVPENLVIVLDTLKFLNRSILNKDANAKVMHRIKALTNKGVTFITLHHTNKDGENFAGTAEIEQDSDALLKIETTDAEEEHMKISTIKAGGRVRFFFQPQSFRFKQGDPTSVEMLERPVDTERLEQLKKDEYLISIIKGLLLKKGELTKTDLEAYLKEDDDFDCSSRERKRIIREYTDVHWKIRKEGDRGQFHYYWAIDTVSKTISSLNDSISAP